MNATDYFSTAIHEASHHVMADSFKICSYPELTPNGRSTLYPDQPAATYSGLCHLERLPSKFQDACIGWSGVLGECMFATAPDWAPKLKPTEKMLADWFSVVLSQVHRLSDGDQRGIRCKETWRACKSAYRMLRKNRARC